MKNKDIVLKKVALREKMSCLRNQLESTTRIEMSNRISKQVMTFCTSEVVYCYGSFRDEVDTWRLIEQLIVGGKKVALPKVEENTLQFYEYTSPKDLVLGRFGIWEPKRTKVVEERGIILCPGLAFTKAGIRIGYGKGYYDRYFEKYKSRHPLKIGLGFTCQLIDNIPTNSLDIAMDMIVTDTKVIICKNEV